MPTRTHIALGWLYVILLPSFDSLGDKTQAHGALPFIAPVDQLYLPRRMEEGKEEREKNATVQGCKRNHDPGD